MNSLLILLQAYDPGAGLIYLLIVAGVALVAFLIFRAIVLWYWQIDKRLRVLEEIRDILTEIRDEE